MENELQEAICIGQGKRWSWFWPGWRQWRGRGVDWLKIYFDEASGGLICYSLDVRMKREHSVYGVLRDCNPLPLHRPPKPLCPLCASKWGSPGHCTSLKLCPGRLSLLLVLQPGPGKLRENWVQHWVLPLGLSSLVPSGRVLEAEGEQCDCCKLGALDSRLWDGVFMQNVD